MQETHIILGSFAVERLWPRAMAHVVVSVGMVYCVILVKETKGQT